MKPHWKQSCLQFGLCLSMLFLLSVGGPLSGGAEPLPPAPYDALDTKSHPSSVAESLLMSAITDNDLTTFRDYFEKNPRFKKEVDLEYLLMMAVGNARLDFI